MKEEKEVEVVKKPINRFREMYTTIIGVVIMLATVGLWITSKFMDFEVTYLELGSCAALGWVFLRAKDTLIEGLFKNYFTKK